MKYRNLILPIVLSLSVFLGGCVPEPTYEEISNFDYGSAISQSSAEQKAKDFLSRKLKDPSSAQYQWDNVYSGYKYSRVSKKRDVGYLLEGNVNSKNSYGAYTGFKPYWFIFYNGRIKSVYAQIPLTSGGATYMGKIY